MKTQILYKQLVSNLTQMLYRVKFKWIFLFFLFFSISNSAFSQCLMGSESSAPANTTPTPTCSSQTRNLGAGASVTTTFSVNVTYSFSVAAGTSGGVNGVCINGTSVTSSPYTFPSATGTYSISANRNGAWNGNSAVLTYSIIPTVGGSIAGSSTVCNGTNSTGLTLSGHTGAITKWQSSTVSDFSSSVTDIANTTTTNTATNLTTTTYYRAVVQNGACASVVNSAIATVTVNASVTAGVIATAQTICNGATPANLTSTTDGTGPGTITYEWQTNASGSYVDIASQVSTTYQPPSLTATTSYKRRTKSVSAGTTCYSSYATAVQVTVNTAVTAGVVATAQTICNGITPANLTSTTDGTGPGTITYEWQTNASGSYVDIATEVSTTYQPPTLTATTSYQRRTKSVSGGITCYSGYATAITIVVNNAVTAGVVAAAQTICYGATPALLTSTTDGTGSGTITYEWQTNASGSYVDIGGATSATYQPPALTATTSYKRRTKSVSGGITCYSSYATAITVTVNNSTITLGANTVASAYACASATKVPIQSFSLISTVCDGNLTVVTFTTTGTYAQADITKYQLWKSATNDISTAAQVGADLATSGGAGARSFAAFASPTLTAGTTYYFWITVTIAAAPTLSNTIACDATVTTSLTSTSTKAGSTTAGGTRTFNTGAPNAPASMNSN